MSKLLNISMFLVLLWLYTTPVYGQTYSLHWPFSAGYSSSMTISAQVTLDGAVCEGSQWECGAFIDDDCRYSQCLQKDKRSDKWVMYLGVQFNQEDVGKLTTFKLYNHQTMTEYLISEKIPAKINANYGLTAPDYEYYMFYAGLMNDAPFASGEVTEESPFELSTPNDLVAFGDYAAIINSKVFVKLTTDIDMLGYEWPIIVKDIPF